MRVIDAHGHPPLDGYVEDAAEMIKSMDTVGIDIKVLLGLSKDMDPEFHYGETDPSTGVKTLSSNEWIAKAIKGYPARFLGFTCLDPTRKEAIQELEETITKYDFKGVKLFPCRHHYEPNDRKIYLFYEKCVELGVPVAFHMGATLDPGIDLLKLQSPLLLDDLAHDLPELKIIICHAGGIWFQEGTMIACRNENVYVDISGMHGHCARTVLPIEPATVIKRIVAILGDEKIMYGADTADRIMNVFFIEGLGLGEATTRKIMGENAARLLNLPLESE